MIENACFKEGVDFVVQTVACSECLISLAQAAQKQNILQVLYRSLCMCYNSEPTTEINDIIMPVLKQACITFQTFLKANLKWNFEYPPLEGP